MKKLISILISMILISGCYKIEESIELTYKISGGYVPEQYKDWHDVITIKNDGTIIRDYKFESEIKKQEKLSVQELNEFKKLVLEANVFELNNNYDSKCENNTTICETIVDGPYHRIEFIIDGKTKSIGMVIPGYAPKELQDIINKLNEFKERKLALGI